MFALKTTFGGGVELKSIARGFSDFWYSNVEQQTGAAGVTPETAYEYVGAVNRGLNILANKVADFPFSVMVGGEDIKDNPKYAFLNSIFGEWHELLYAFTIMYMVKRGAYIYISRNAQGKNIIPVLLFTDDVQPVYKDNILAGFRYYGSAIDPQTKRIDPITQATTGSPIPRDIGLGDMLWLWNMSVRQDHSLYPGKSPLEAALADAGVVYALSAQIKAYFDRGGSPLTVFLMPPGIDKNAREEFQGFLNRLASGVMKMAYRFQAMRGDVKTQQLGSSPKEAQAPELHKQSVHGVLQTLGIPPTIVDDDAANYAIANAAMVKLYTLTVIPLWERIAALFNKRIFEAGRSDIRIVGNPRGVEELQDAFLQQAKSVYEASGERPMTAAEGRSILELPPLPGAEAEVVQLNGAQLSSMLQITVAVGKGELSPAQGAAMLQAGFPQLTPAQISAMTTPPEKPEPPPAPIIAQRAPPVAAEDTEPEIDEEETEESPDAEKAMGEWRKALLADFTAPAPPGIPAATKSAVEAELPNIRTRSQLRALFAKHWPGNAPAAAPVVPQEVVRLLERAVKLQEAKA